MRRGIVGIVGIVGFVGGLIVLGGVTAALGTPQPATSQPSTTQPATAQPATEPASLPLTVGEYRNRLSEIERALRARDGATARAAASALQSARYVAGGETLDVDHSLLGEIAAASDVRLAYARFATRVARLIATLDAVGEPRLRNPTPTPTTGGETPLTALERLRKAEELAPRPQGGAFPEPGEASLESAEALTSWWEPIRQWFRRMLEKILNWLFPRLREPRQTSAFHEVATWVAIGLAVGIAAFGLVQALRGRGARRRSDPKASGRLALAPEADDDPMSRETSEWERYAAELARAGRLREAVRAWYHAVLVALYRTGHAHERKGRTNWELVATLSPALPWRGDFADLTRRFEREWFGRDESDLVALDEAAAVAQQLLLGIHRGIDRREAA